MSKKITKGLAGATQKSTLSPKKRLNTADVAKLLAKKTGTSVAEAERVITTLHEVEKNVVSVKKSAITYRGHSSIEPYTVKGRKYKMPNGDTVVTKDDKRVKIRTLIK